MTFSDIKLIIKNGRTGLYLSLCAGIHFVLWYIQSAVAWWFAGLQVSSEVRDPEEKSCVASLPPAITIL